MISRRSTFFLGIFIFLIPFLGIPTSWKTIFITVSGLVLIGFSVRIALPKKNQRPRARKEKITPVFAQNAPVFPQSNINNEVYTEQKVNSESGSNTE